MITRRELLVTTGAISLAGSVKWLREGPLRLVDGQLSEEELSIGKQAMGVARPRVLQLDLVREWRDELHSHVARGVEIVAVTRWDKALVFRELAREARFATKQERIAPSLFRTEVSLRG